MNFAACSSFIQVDEADLYTVLCLPAPDGKYPVVLFRTPYDDAMSKMGDAEIQLIVLQQQREWLENGYAVVWQHCRGTGRSTGDCIPYRNERKDGLALQQWVRQQPFYNGEIYLCGGSYLSSVHYLTAPFAPDIRGAVLRIQDTERYNVCYRNGFFKCGLHGSWYVGMYKKKSLLQKNYTDESFQLLPMEDFSKTVFGEDSPDLDQTLAHPRRDDPFWQTPLGGSEAHNAVANAGIPILLTTGFYDIYTGGIFDMWNAMDDATRAISALAVCPYDHSCTETNQPVAFEHGRFEDVFGNYAIRWINSIRGKEAPPFEPGKVTYYRLFDGRWAVENFANGPQKIEIPLGQGEVSYLYNPYAPARFKGGLSGNFGGTAFQDVPNSRYDIKSFFSMPFPEDRFIKGKMKARLCVKSDCEDTCFYVRISLVQQQGAYGLRDDIQSISNFQTDYVPGSEVMLDFSFDEHAFRVRAGEQIRIDISSSAFPFYLRHTNQKGPFAQQRTAKIAHNTVVCEKSSVTLFAE